MKFEGKNEVAVYLEDWQMKMVKDVLGKDCHVWCVPTDSGPVMKYGAPTAVGTAPHSVQRMYLTSWQKRQIADASGESCPCEFVELESDMIVRYGAPSPG